MKKWTLLFLGLILSGNTFAAGFEKTVLWSGKHAGTANAAVSSVSTSEALFFNPAGLAGADAGDVSVNFSPIFSKFTAPLTQTLDNEDSKQAFSPIFGLTGAYRLGSKVVFGLGTFVSGGVNTTYDDSSLPDDIKGKLELIDFAVGLGYQINKRLRLGASWKATWAKAELASHAPDLTGLGGAPEQVVSIKELEKWNFTGLRIGMQYIVPDQFGLGLNVRTPVTLEMEGKAESTLGVSDNDAELKSTLPLQVTAGAHFYATKAWKWYTQVDWTNYSHNKSLEVVATLGGNAVPDITLDWSDMIVARLGTEYDIDETWTVRGGYAFTNQVTNENRAKPTFSTPGIAHTLLVGGGAHVGNFDFNLALDYSWAKSKGADDTYDFSAIVPTADFSTSGDYKVVAYGAHLGMTYNF